MNTKLIKILAIILALVGIGIPSLSCASKSNPASAAENQIVAVQRGDLTIDITAAGNLELSRKEDLAFDIFYLEATVAEVLVEEGDTVKEGQTLAKLNTSEWDEQLSTLEDKVITAQRSLTTAERQLTTKQNAVIQAQINVNNAENAVFQATTLVFPEVEVAQATLDKAKYYVQYASDKLKAASSVDEQIQWSRLLKKAEADYANADDRLNILLSDATTDQVVIKRQEAELARSNLENAKIAVEDAKISIEDARRQVERAQKTLDEAKSKSPLITAPFDGFITSVNAAGGDTVKKGHIAATLADPNKFQAYIMVSEMDISRVNVGGEARVKVDSLPGISLPAKVTHIAPTATIQSGVVNYKVKVEVESPAAAAATTAAAPEHQQTQGSQQRQAPTATPQNFQLREGLTVTVSIIVAQKNDVLLVPNTAITRQGKETTVQVVRGDSTESRSIKTGLSNWQYTEVTEGLSEGEKVSVPQSAKTTTTTQQQPPGGMIRIPGVGGVGR